MWPFCYHQTLKGWAISKQLDALWNHESLLQRIFCWNATEKRILEKCLAPKPAYRSFKRGEYVIGYCKGITNLLGYFRHAWLWPAKTILPRCSKLWCLCSCKKIIFIPHLSVEILQIYLGYFGHTWVRPPKGIGPTCRKLWCLSANKNSTWFLNFLKRYYTLKNPTIWLVNNILGNNSRIKILLNMGFPIESQEIHIASFVGKTNDKIFKRKISKIPVQICSWAKVNFWQKLGSITFQRLWSPNFKYKIRKNNEPILRKKLLKKGQANTGQTIGPSGETGWSKKK